MVMAVQVTIDCDDPAGLAPFWAAALGYEVQPPPEGFESWPAALTAWGVPEAEWNSASAVVDPSGAGPRVFLQRVPEPKSAKNRVHLDLRASDGLGISVGQKRAQVMAAVARLVDLGARGLGQVERMGSFWAVMQDPEGNEFCVT